MKNSRKFVLFLYFYVIDFSAHCRIEDFYAAIYD